MVRYGRFANAKALDLVMITVLLLSSLLSFFAGQAHAEYASITVDPTRGMWGSTVEVNITVHDPSWDAGGPDVAGGHWTLKIQDAENASDELYIPDDYDGVGYYAHTGPDTWSNNLTIPADATEGLNIIRLYEWNETLWRDVVVASTPFTVLDRPISVTTPTPSSEPTPTPTPATSPPTLTNQPGSSATPTSTSSKEQYLIKYHTGNVQVQHEGALGWVPVTDSTVIHMWDTIRVTGNPSQNKVVLYHAGSNVYINREICLAGGSQMELSPVNSEAEYLYYCALSLFGLGYFEDEVAVTTSNAIIKPQGTQFEVVANETGTIVYVFGGSVSITDLTGANSVSVSANQTCTVPTGGVLGNPTFFNANTADQWWTTIPGETANPLSGFTLQQTQSPPNQTVSFLAVIAVITVAVVIVVVLSRRQTRSPPPPPPSPY